MTFTKSHLSNQVRAPMKMICLLLLIATTAIAQSEVHKIAVDKFMKDYNNNDFERVYQSFAPK